MSTETQGTCLCKGVRFTIRGALAPVQVCHCSQCRQAHGGPFAAVIPVDRSALRFLAGEDLLQHYESSPGKYRAFCRVCGSPVFSRRDALPGVLRVRAGLLLEPVATQLAFHAFTASRASWWPITDTLPQYEASAPAQA